MFADIRKKFCAALVGSLMFFGAPGCSAIGGAGIAMIGSGILSTLAGGVLTLGTIMAEVRNTGGAALIQRPDVPIWAKILGHCELFAPGAIGLGAGTGLIAGGTQH